MNGRMSLVEQKRLQWAKEREEMARLSSSLWGNEPAGCNVVQQTIRSAVTICEDYAAVPNHLRIASTPSGSPHSLSSRMSALMGAPVLKRGYGSDTTTSSKNFDRVAGDSHLLRASLISLHDAAGVEDRVRNAPIVRQRSPSLPPIYTRESGASLQQLNKQTEVDQVESRHRIPDQTLLNHRKNHYLQNYIRSSHYGSPRDELEGETSGYASDSAEVSLPTAVDVLPNSICKPPGTAMSENSLQNSKNYIPYLTPENSLPPSRRLSAVKGCAEVRPRWGGLWGQEIAKGDPPPPSWLERGLSRMDHTSQVLVINHESASSSEKSSTSGSAGSDSTKTYLRGQNVPLDERILQEREARRQKALELQSAIKHQLEERDRRRREEKEQRLNEERAEEERIRRERNEEKQRFEEEQKRFKEKEDAKHKKEEAMRQVLEAAERLAQEEKKFRRKRNEAPKVQKDEISADAETLAPSTQPETCYSRATENVHDDVLAKDNPQLHYAEHCFRQEDDKSRDHPPKNDPNRETGMRNDVPESKVNTIQLPVSPEVAIVLSGRLRDPEVLNASNLQVNLVVMPSPTKSEIISTSLSTGKVFLPHSVSPTGVSKADQSRYSEAMDARLLTPSKYRMAIGREFGTQTDLEDVRENGFSSKEMSMKERKESLNANRRYIEKSGNTVLTEELSMKTLSRSKVQSRSSLEARPRWNANRPGTRYRTQSEKDPHYQRRLRLRSCQPDSSDEGSRSPSPGRKKPNNLKSKSRNTTRRKMKLDSYDADLSMDSLNFIVPLRVDKSGKINIENNRDERKSMSRLTDIINSDEKMSSINKEGNRKLESWCGREILSQLITLRNGLVMQQKEWDPQRCLLSPNAESYIHP